MLTIFQLSVNLFYLLTRECNCQGIKKGPKKKNTNSEDRRHKKQVSVLKLKNRDKTAGSKTGNTDVCK